LIIEQIISMKVDGKVRIEVVDINNTKIIKQKNQMLSQVLMVEIIIIIGLY